MERMLRAALVVLALGAAGCSLGKQDAPALSGPSEYGRSITVTASTDRLSQDGVSQIEVVATVRNEKSEPVPGFVVQWKVTASTGILVEPSEQRSTTDARGIARMVVTAPPPPAVVPASTATLTISASEVGTDAYSTTNARYVQVQLVPPPGTLLPNRNPVAVFTVVPAVGVIMQDITFDASLSTDEGEPCGSACTYRWDFGDFLTGSGIHVSHHYERPATYTVVLTVVDPRGGVGSATRSLAISGPAAPTASFTVTPATVVGGGGVEVRFDASASTVGVGGTIVKYEWDFGDGDTQTTDVPVVRHAYGGVSQDTIRDVKLIVTDNFGRTAMAFRAVTVTP